MKQLCLIGAFLFLALAACHRPVETRHGTSLTSELVVIDSLMQNRPDSALTLLQASPKEDPYYQLLLSEALYKNDSAQLNRPKLIEAMAYYDSLGCPLLSARCHYMNGVGYYESDSLVQACEQYLKALEIMEDNYKEEDLVGYKAKFMALIYTHLCGLFYDQYLNVQAIFFARKAYDYFLNANSNSFQLAWSLNKIGTNYEMMAQWDSAAYYYYRAATVLNDTNSLIYRDIVSHQTMVDYKMGIGYEESVARLRNLLSQANTDNEYIVRCLVLGEVFYHEKDLDSAEFYLKKVFYESDNFSLKKQASEWLVEILKDKGENEESQQFADYLVPFANLSENQGFIKSQMADIYQCYEQRRKENMHSVQVAKIIKLAVIVLIVFITSILFVALLYCIRIQQLKHERYEHSMKQAALAGRLKRSNAALKKEKTFPAEAIILQAHNHSAVTKYVDEPICRHILEVCNDEKNPIKSNLPISSYSDIALTLSQKAQLKAAALLHYRSLFEKLKTDYPKLKEKDYLYCYLCLLELDDAQIAVMTQLSYRTVWERGKRLQKIFNTDDKISVFLHGNIIC